MKPSTCSGSASQPVSDLAGATTRSTLFLCRGGFESTLAEEVSASSNILNHRVPFRGGLLVNHTTPLPQQTPFVFERLRLLDPVFIPASQLKPVELDTALKILHPALHSTIPWSFTVLVPHEEENPGIRKRAEGFRSALLRVADKSGKHPSAPGAGVVPLAGAYTLDGLWSGTLAADPGDIELTPARMKMDDAAPSRSYLKIEEVFYRSGREPGSGQTVVDLGAAPGGWTYACLKRGCSVTAVDHGPMKLSTSAARPDFPTLGKLQHLRENGLTYRPAKPVDWLVADMLIPPGQALGLLKRWLGSRWCRNFIINIKLPQEKPWPALCPVVGYLKTIPDLTFTVSQLFHDRREVTAWGFFDFRPKL